jgi:hypothetical protein
MTTRNAYRLQDGTEIDLGITTVVGLSRLGQSDFLGVLKWLGRRRLEAEQRAAAVDRRVSEIAAELKPKLEAQHARQVAWSKRNL